MKKWFLNFFASGFFISYIPASLTSYKKFKGCGFFGTLLAALIINLIKKPEIIHLTALILIPFSIYISHNAYDNGEKDNPLIVIDEIAGFFFIFLFFPKTPHNILLSFVIFRLFDTVKPYPIKKLESIKHRGIAVVIDDIVAAVYTVLVIFIYNLIKSLL